VVLRPRFILTLVIKLVLSDIIIIQTRPLASHRLVSYAKALSVGCICMVSRKGATT